MFETEVKKIGRARDLKNQNVHILLHTLPDAFKRKRSNINSRECNEFAGISSFVRISYTIWRAISRGGGGGVIHDDFARANIQNNRIIIKHRSRGIIRVYSPPTATIYADEYIILSRRNCFLNAVGSPLPVRTRHYNIVCSRLNKRNC